MSGVFYFRWFNFTLCDDSLVKSMRIMNDKNTIINDINDINGNYE